MPEHAAGTLRRVVFDTNVLLSLYVFADSRFQALRVQAESGYWRALTSPACLDEFKRVLAYPQFTLDAAKQTAACAAYCAVVEMVEDAHPERFDLPRCRDRDDQKFLELARDGQADFLVTADKALLTLARRQKMHGRFRIMTPEVMLGEVGKVDN